MLSQTLKLTERPCGGESLLLTENPGGTPVEFNTVRWDLCRMNSVKLISSVYDDASLSELQIAAVVLAEGSIRE